MSRRGINTAQNIFLNNVGVDDVYRDNQHICLQEGIMYPTMELIQEVRVEI